MHPRCGAGRRKDDQERRTEDAIMDETYPPPTVCRTAAEAIERVHVELEWARDELAQVYATLAVALATIEQTEALRPRRPGFHRP